MGTTPEPRYRRASAIRKVFDLSPKSLQHLADRGLIPPPIRVSSRLTLWDYPAVVAYLEAQQARREVPS